MPQINYFEIGVILLGMATITIQASKTYSTPLLMYRYSRYPILQKVELSSLGSRREYTIGFLFYISMIYIIYFFIIYFYDQINMLDLSGIKLAGPNSPIAKDGNYNPAVPLIVSASFVTILSVEQFSAIEENLRHLAHRFAGIPRGIYRILTELNQFDCAQLFSNASRSEIKSTTKALMRMCDSAKNKDEIKEILVESEDIRNLISRLQTISVLYSASIASAGHQIWDESNLESIGAGRDDVNKSIEDLIKSVNDITKSAGAEIERGDDKTQNDNYLEELSGKIESAALQADGVSHDVLALFALHYIAEQDVQVPNQYPAIREIVKVLRSASSPDPIWGGYVGSCVVGSGVAVLLCTIGLTSFWTLFPVDAGTARDFALLSAKIPVATSWAVEASARSAVLYSVTLGLALSTRTSWIEIDQWKGWRQLPFGRFMGASAFPVLIGTIVCIMYSYVVYIAKITLKSKGVPSSSILQEFWGSYGFLILLESVGIILLCWAAFVIADKHLDSKFGIKRTFLVAVNFSAIYALYVFYCCMVYMPIALQMNHRNVVEEVVTNALSCFSFIACFAVFVERSERADSVADTGSVSRGLVAATVRTVRGLGRRGTRAT